MIFFPIGCGTSPIFDNGTAATITIIFFEHYLKAGLKDNSFIWSCFSPCRCRIFCADITGKPQSMQGGVL
jgi:hypothetical protein